MKTSDREIERLLAEVRRYLIAVDAFRAEGREPRWLAELVGRVSPDNGPVVAPHPTR